MPDPVEPPTERQAVAKSKEILAKIEVLEKGIKLLAESVRALETEIECYTIPAGTEILGVKFE